MLDRTAFLLQEVGRLKRIVGRLEKERDEAVTACTAATVAREELEAQNKQLRMDKKLLELRNVDLIAQCIEYRKFRAAVEQKAKSKAPADQRGKSPAEQRGKKDTAEVPAQE